MKYTVAYRQTWNQYYESMADRKTDKQTDDGKVNSELPVCFAGN